METDDEGADVKERTDGGRKRRRVMGDGQGPGGDGLGTGDDGVYGSDGRMGEMEGGKAVKAGGSGSKDDGDDGSDGEPDGETSGFNEGGFDRVERGWRGRAGRWKRR